MCRLQARIIVGEFGVLWSDIWQPVLLTPNSAGFLSGLTRTRLSLGNEWNTKPRFLTELLEENLDGGVQEIFQNTEITDSSGIILLEWNVCACVCVCVYTIDLPFR